MEKVISYKASNGRLFESEEKCLAYEKKMSQYPKTRETLRMAYTINGKRNKVDVVRHTIERWDKPSARKSVEKYYIVGYKYKFVDLYGRHDFSVMNGRLLYGGEVTMDWQLSFCHFAEQILLGNELSDEFVKSEVEKLNEVNGVKLVVKVIEPNKKWEIDNPAWVGGAVSPYTFTMEKLN